jgi:hypothetical protein
MMGMSRKLSSQYINVLAAGGLNGRCQMAGNQKIHDPFDPLRSIVAFQLIPIGATDITLRALNNASIALRRPAWKKPRAVVRIAMRWGFGFSFRVSNKVARKRYRGGTT